MTLMSINALSTVLPSVTNPCPCLVYVSTNNLSCDLRAHVDTLGPSNEFPRRGRNQIGPACYSWMGLGLCQAALEVKRVQHVCS